MDIQFITEAAVASDAAVAVLAFENKPLSAAARRFDESFSGALSRAFNARFKGQKETHAVVSAGRTVLIIGAGDIERAPLAIEEIAAYAYRAADAIGVETLVLHLPDTGAEAAARAAFGARLGAYRFHRHKNFPRPAEQPALHTLQIVAAHPELARVAYAKHSAIADG
ncbi:M17 family peptidase N-terminal domain-containing protein, partial [Steroidobacter sp.]|uniref:M17 family peptidase N-terminal domain-containing protein n=1 Tax=Steroidobacter sp. TaxID=1978227 RepID=UPI001A5BCB29